MMGPPPRRVHALDWVRGVLIFFVVYAHTSQSLGTLGAAGSPSTAYVSAARPWCIPLLFWVSGAASALSSRDVRLLPLAAVLGAGVASNSLLWLAGPGDPACSSTSPCPGKGRLFHFTIAPNSGHIFPLVYQMWYVAALLLFAALTRPLELRLRSCGEDPKGRWLMLGGQCAVTCGVYAALWATSQQPDGTLPALALSEGAFLLVCGAGAAAPGRPRRLLTYVAAVAGTAQFTWPAIAGTGTVGSGMVLWFMLFKQHYVLGLMCRAGEWGCKVAPLVSALWPVAGLLGAVVLPAPPQYAEGGALAYPYQQSAASRFGYAFAAVCVALCVDRLSRSVYCAPMPRALRMAALGMYLLHPWAVSIVCSLDYREPPGYDRTLCVSLLAAAISGGPFAAACTLCCGDLQRPPLQHHHQRGRPDHEDYLEVAPLLPSTAHHHRHEPSAPPAMWDAQPA
eukprot:TRINITY_DN14718_c0_g1_i1.p1 TRINITY_DN14718_c0_g1~~TRINITY_DN14718_c0_g1_i1.p1  ORF type:complete len:480 (+),score=119.87 TRINITY_DN14718_c0_g1_i1:85-1440(+)